MKERPILFSGPMVKAILEGRKTQTRRTLEPRWTFGDGSWQQVASSPGYWNFSRAQHHVNCIPCPYGQPGDRLWVRETWMPDGADVRFEMMKRGEIPWAVRYAASEPGLGKMFRWHPSIHMPRAASRLSLEITKVGVERLQDISGPDALAEGIRGLGRDPEQQTYEAARKRAIEETEASARVVFRNLWDAINGDRGFGWEKNPWVWVIEFKRVEATA